MHWIEGKEYLILTSVSKQLCKLLHLRYSRSTTDVHCHLLKVQVRLKHLNKFGFSFLPLVKIDLQTLTSEIQIGEIGS